MLKPLPPRPARGIPLARWLSAFAAAVAAEAIAARWLDLVDTATLLACLAGALLFALSAFAAVSVALAEVWRRGAPGVWGALGALAATLLVLVPFAGAAAAIVLLPPISDVSTDWTDPPAFLRRPAPQALAVPGVAVAAPADPAAQALAYPDVLSRTLPLSTVEAHAAVRQTALELGWTVVAETEPVGESDAGSLEAETRSLLLGTPDDVVVRVTPAAGGARVDLRSASRLLAHDLGENARRIRGFFSRLEEVTARTAGG